MDTEMTATPSRLLVSGAATPHASKLPVFARIANEVARWSGKPLTVAFCCLLVVVWAATGPLFHYSDTWQLVINTGTTIVTFLMVFLIQNTQNREGMALQAKLDELIRVTRLANNDLVAAERLSEEKVDAMREGIAAAGADR